MVDHNSVTKKFILGVVELHLTKKSLINVFSPLILPKKIHCVLELFSETGEILFSLIN